MYEYRCSNEECNKVWTINEGDIGTLYLTCPYCKKGKGNFLRQIKEKSKYEDIEKIIQKQADNVESESYNLTEKDESSDKFEEQTMEEDNNADVRPNYDSESEEDTENKESEGFEEIREEQITSEEDEQVQEQDSINEENNVGEEYKVDEDKNVNNIDQVKDNLYTQKDANYKEELNEQKEQVKNYIETSQDSKDQLKVEPISEEDDIFEQIRKKRQLEEEIRKNCPEGVDVLEISGDSEEEIERKISEFEQEYYIKVLDKIMQQQGNRLSCIIKYARK